MDNLRFGTTARRKEHRRRRTRRIVLALWALSVLGVLAGTPVTRTTALDVLEQFAVPNAEAERARASTTSLDISGVRPDHPAPSVTLGHDGKKKLPSVVVERRDERRKELRKEQRVARCEETTTDPA